MNLRRLTRTAPFRLSMLYAGMFSFSAIVLFAVLYIHITEQVSAHIRNSINDEMASVQEEAGLIGGLQAAVQSRVRLKNEQFDYMLVDAKRQPLAGHWRAPLNWRVGWQDLPPPGAEIGKYDTDYTVLAVGKPMPDGSLLIVGRPVKSLIEIKEIIQQAFIVSGILIFLLSVGGGLMMSAAFLREIDRFNMTASRIMAGNMKERIPLRGTRDAFDQLAANLNLMLDKVESFMEGMRQVSNDIAHDLRTPLTRLRQNLEGASLKAKSVAEFKAATEKALTETDEVLATFSGMLRISQIEAGSGGMEAKFVDMSALCAKILEIYEPLARDKGSRIGSSIAPDIHFKCNEMLMTQLIVNLIENSLNHTPQGTDIMLELLVLADKTVVVGVNDRGPGIAEADRERVVKRFVRLEQSRNTPGNGLGLALVSAVANRFGGYLTLNDNRPGLRADVYFPTEK